MILQFSLKETAMEMNEKTMKENAVLFKAKIDDPDHTIYNLEISR